MPRLSFASATRGLILFGACLVGCALFADDPAPVPRVITHDNTRPAGVLQGNALAINLEIAEGEWYPEADQGPHIRVYGFAEAGRAPSIPGPLIRVRAGTVVRARVRNATRTAMSLHGFNQRPDNDAPVTLAPGEAHELRFLAGAPGTYFYWAGPPGTTLDGPTQRWDGLSSQLAGALIVDGATPEPDRVFVLGLWRQADNPSTMAGLREFATINGRSWPYTERLHYRVGESVRWRWVNPTGAVHPMHMHGAFYRVDALGDFERSKLLAPQMRPMVVTQLMPQGTTMEATWSPERPGHWLFHCHLAAHLAPENSLTGIQAGLRTQDARMTMPADAGMDTSSMGMVGLVMGIDVEGSARIEPASLRPTRQLALVIQEQQQDPLRAAVTVVEGRQTASAPGLSGPPIVLHQGEPVAITVENRLRQPTSIHWHGMELESYYDGVAHFSGVGDHVTPSIPAGGRFVARFNPPRPGTFIYHSHWHDVSQLAGGVYGALIVLPPGKSYDPATDVALVGGRGCNGELLINGQLKPAALQWRAGRRYHLRLVDISPSEAIEFSMVAAAGKQQWRADGKDGMLLPPPQRLTQAATQRLFVGETYDFEFTPPKGDLTLHVLRPGVGVLVEQQTIDIPIHVR